MIEFGGQGQVKGIGGVGPIQCNRGDTPIGAKFQQFIFAHYVSSI
jgi:hypothetical protein